MKKDTSIYARKTRCLPIAVLFLCVSIFCSDLPVYGSQPNSVALVIAVRGTAQALDDKGISRQLKVKSPLFEHDLLSTGKKGRLQIMFTDNTIVSLGRGASLQISEYILNKDQTGKLSTKVSEGVFRVMGGALARNSPGNFKTLTPSGNIGIRGSMYTGRVSNGETSVVFEGGIGITFRNKTGFIDISRPGHGTRVKGVNSMIPKPYKFSKNELNLMQRELVMRPPKGAGTKSQPASSFKVPINFSKINAASLKPASRCNEKIGDEI